MAFEVQSSGRSMLHHFRGSGQLARTIHAKPQDAALPGEAISY